MSLKFKTMLRRVFSQNRYFYNCLVALTAFTVWLWQPTLCSNKVVLLIFCSTKLPKEGFKRDYLHAIGNFFSVIWWPGPLKAVRRLQPPLARQGLFNFLSYLLSRILFYIRTLNVLNFIIMKNINTISFLTRRVRVKRSIKSCAY